MHCLNIHLHSFQLSNDLVSPNDKVRVSITTIPERNKQAFVIEAKKINKINHVFSVGITDQTTRIILVIRRKSFIYNDPIISSTSIYSKDFPNYNSNITCTDPLFINLYEKVLNQPDKKTEDRRIIGFMKLHYSITDEIKDQNVHQNKSTQELIFSKLKFFKNNENQNQNKQDMIFSIMLIDEN